MSCAPNVSIVIEKLQLFLEIDINHFFYPESVHLPRSRAGRSRKQVELGPERASAPPGRFPWFFACLSRAWQEGRSSAHPHLNFSILVWNHPALPWWERGWGWEWECLCCCDISSFGDNCCDISSFGDNNYQLSVEQAGTNFWAISA
jgi:hypothetical protein